MMMHVINVKLAQVLMVSVAIKALESFQLKFIFQFIGTPAIRSRYAKVTVLVPPDDPKIVKGNTSIDHMVTTEDREIELECISSGGKPAAEVSFSNRSQVISCLESPLPLILFPIHLFYESVFHSTPWRRRRKMRMCPLRNVAVGRKF